jgi:carbon monoxide dehydrogenase subunit G
MSVIEVEKLVAAPRERVFEVITNLEGAAETIRGIQKLEVLTDGPVGVGTRWRETRVMFKREATEEMEITAFDPPNGYDVGAESHGCRYHSEFRLTPEGEGTKLTWRFEATPQTLPAKVMGFLFKGMMKSVAKECLKDLEDIAAAAEGRAGEPVASS